MIPFDRRQHSTSLSTLTLMRGRAHVSDFSEGRGGGFGHCRRGRAKRGQGKQPDAPAGVRRGKLAHGVLNAVRQQLHDQRRGAARFGPVTGEKGGKRLADDFFAR